MLDTHARKLIQPFFEGLASIFITIGLSPTQVTLIAGATGVCSALFVLINMPITAILLLWISGMLDAVDGTMARKLNQQTKWGTFLDILSDRLVEVTIILALATHHPDAIYGLLILTVTIILSLTAFFTAGTLVDLKSEKSFYYQAGLAERTEGFIFLTLMILLPAAFIWITLIFAAVVLFTAFQRSYQLYKILYSTER